ncbi:MAG: polysaccharide biosynthesis C-terminal domain-containing protein [Deltaproteobacteria bacterium]|nr:polysaccharide biosynthesis C-terminal domain-containing protein [Deltaproteobacteria bacterium]
MIRAITLTITAAFIGTLLAFAADVLIAGYFGTSWRSDAYYLAFVIPTLIADMFVLGINSVFVPVYASDKSAGNGDEFFSAAANVIVVSSVIMAAAAFYFTPLLIDVVAGGFTHEALSVTVALTRLMLILLVLIPISTLMSNRLNAHGHFILPALGKTINYLFVIAAIVVLKDAVGVFSMPVGFITGAAVFIIILAYLFLRCGLGYRLCARVNNPALMESVVLVYPLLIVTLFHYVNIMVERGVASGLEEGSISALNFAFKIVNMPVNLFILGAMPVVLPAFSEIAAAKDPEALGGAVLKGLRFVSFFAVPFTVALLILREPIVRILFERGAFVHRSTEVTSSALFFYAFSIFGFAAVNVMSRVFYALKEIKMLSVIAGLIIVLSIVLIVTFSAAFGFIGIPLAFSVVTTLHMTVLGVWLFRRLRIAVCANILKGFLIHCVCAAIMGVAVRLFAGCIGLSGLGRVSGGIGHDFSALALTVFSGAFVYFMLSYLFKVEEMTVLTDAAGRLAARLKGGKAPFAGGGF